MNFQKIPPPPFNNLIKNNVLQCNKSIYLLSALLITSVISPVVQADSNSARQCDELASHPDNKYKPNNIKGVKFKDIDTTRAIPACKQAVSEQPNVLRYQYQLSRAYYKTKQYDKALKLTEPLANQGYAPAQHNLGVMYDKGKGVAQDYKKAIYWFQKSANQDYDYGQFSLGYMYEEGRGVAQDYKKAVSWYKKSANQGNEWGQNNLGTMYENGKGVPQSYEKAIEWYQKSANQGNKKAKENLARLKEKGIY